MPIYNCSDMTMHSIISMNYLSGVSKFEMLMDTYDEATDKTTYKFNIRYHQDGKILDKTLTFNEVLEYMQSLKSTADMLDSIVTDIRSI